MRTQVTRGRAMGGRAADVAQDKAGELADFSVGLTRCGGFRLWTPLGEIHHTHGAATEAGK